MFLKKPMDSQYIQASFSKSIFHPNIWGDFHIYPARQSATLTKKCQNDVLCSNKDMDVSPCILKFKFFCKDICSTMTAWIHVGLLYSKTEMIYLPKRICLIIIYCS